MSFNNFKQAEFGKYPVDWSISNLGEIITVLTDYHANGSYKKLKENVELLDEENYAIMIRTTNFEQNAFNKQDFKYITEKAYNFLEKTKVYQNDILMNKIANAGSVYIVPNFNKQVSLAMNLFLIRMNEKIINQKYAYYFMKNHEKYIKSRAQGSVTKTITKHNVRKLEIAYPNIKEQEKIVKIIYDLENKIEINNQINKNLEQIAQTIFKHWFVDFEFPNKEGKPYKSSGGQMVESKLGMIPKDWKVVQLGQLVNTYNGYSYKGKELLKSKDAMVTIKNFDRNGNYKLDGLKEIVISDRVKQHHYVNINDVIVAHTDLTQKAEIIGNPIMIFTKGKYDKIIMSMDTVKVIPKFKEYNNCLIYFVLKDYRFKKYALGYVSGTTVLHLSKSTILKYKIAISHNKNVEKQLGDIFSAIMSKVSNNYKENERLTKIRDILLPKLMSGEIRVPLDN
ncbi:restriction endonuclease subunit S [Clostridium sp. JNZ X4-2]|jgi:type I restriction enzyme S subunit